MQRAGAWTFKNTEDCALTQIPDTVYWVVTVVVHV